MQQIGPLIQHGFDLAKIGAAATFHHITGKREGTAGKTDQRNLIIQRPCEFVKPHPSRNADAPRDQVP